MNKLIATCILLMAAFCGRGQTAVTVGYCGGEVSGDGALTVEGKAWVSGAAYLPASMLARYEGTTITAIRAGLASKINVDTVRVWVRRSLEGDNLAQGTITGKTETKIRKGWNEVTLEQGLTIDATDGLYIGFSYHQKTATGVFSAVGSQLQNAFWAQLAADAPWQDMSQMGILSVEALVEGATQPDYDLGITAAMASTWSDADTWRMTVNISNNGTQGVTGFTLETTYSNREDIYTNHILQDIGAGQTATLTYTIPMYDRQEAGDITVTIAGIDDGTDALAENNTMQARFTLRRKVLVEEYTTEPCSNCPRVAGYLHSVLQEEKYRESVVAVCHHAGFRTDWMTKPCDLDLVNFFGVGYAPAMMWDRAPLFSGGTSCYICPDRSDITTCIDERLAVEPHATLGFVRDFDEQTSTLRITVKGQRSGVFSKNPARLTVYVLENNIPDFHQAGHNGDDPYMQQHVIRAAGSDTWGDVIEWDVNSFSMDYEFAIDDEWNRENLEVVAFVAVYNPNDKNDCVVENAESIPAFPELSQEQRATGIGNIDRYSIEHSELNIDHSGGAVNGQRSMVNGIYDLQGRPMGQALRGVSLMRMADGTMRKVLTP